MLIFKTFGQTHLQHLVALIVKHTPTYTYLYQTIPTYSYLYLLKLTYTYLN